VFRPGLLLSLFLLCNSLSFAGNFTVTTNADAGAGSLREALQLAAANGTSTPDIISFNIPYVNTTSITIRIAAALPEVSSNVTIDGTTQPSAALGVSDARIIIEPVGANNYTAMLDSCLVIRDADNVQIYGLCIRYFYEFAQGGSLHQGIAVWLMNANNLVFGAPGKGNVIAGCCYGVFKAYSPGTVNNVKIQSNIFGVDVDGLTRLVPTFVFSNVGGVELTLSKDAEIGGPTAAEGNLFSGNAFGVGFIEESGTIDIGYNKFGTDYTGNNELGIYGATSAMGARDGSANFFIHNNTVSGESDFNQMSGRFLVTNNYFGTNPSRTVEFTYVGGILDFNNCTGSALIGGNDASTMNVFGNGVLGVGNDNSTKITVLHNSFYCHDEDGIYMNWYTRPNKPFITINKLTASLAAGTARPNSIIELYQTDACRHCEGKTFIARLNADASGNWSYSGALPPNVTGTATNVDDSTTSAFAQPAFDFTTAVVTNATCNRANGKISGIRFGSGTSYTWTDINGNVVGTDSTLTNVAAGQYQLTVGLGTNPCKSSSQYITINNTPPPQLDATAFTVTQPTCGGFNGSAVYNGAYSPNTALWFDLTGDTVQKGAALNKAGDGSYLFRVVLSSDSSCYTNYGPLTLVNQSGPTVNTSAILITGATCGQPDGSITGVKFSNITGAPVYRWYDSLNRLTGTGPDLLNATPGRYLLKFKDQSTCDTIVTRPMTVTNAGAIQFNTGAQTISSPKCTGQGGSITNISVTNGVAYKWIDIKSRAVVSTDKDLLNVPPGAYKLIATSGLGCTDSTDVYNLPLATPAPSINSGSAAVSPDICTQHTGSVKGVTIQGASALSFTWYDKVNLPVAQTRDLTNVGQGVYYLVVTDASNCVDTSASYTIDDLAESIDPPVYNTTYVLKGKPASLIVAHAAPGVYELYPDATAQTPDQKNTTGDFITGPISSDTTVYVVLEVGTCASVMSPAPIKALETVDIVMPNAFTPNSDGQDDLFRIKYPGIVKSVQMVVFNRWGQKVFENADPYKGWDGNANGQAQPMGSYVWMISYTDILGNKKAISGTVLLIR